jgi:MraZ protein
MMFRGQFQHSLDAKGRIAVPARFRDALSDGGACILTPAPFDRCLHLYPLAAWQLVEEKIADLPSMDPNVVRFRRIYVSAACECEVDKAGRLLIPGPQRERIGLDREGLWAGMGRHLELWSVGDWQRALHLEPEAEAEFRRAVLEQIKI